MYTEMVSVYIESPILVFSGYLGYVSNSPHTQSHFFRGVFFVDFDCKLGTSNPSGD